MNDLLARSLSSDPDDWPSFSPSQLSTWDTCERRWHYAYFQELVLDRPNPNMDVGIMIHEAADIWYKSRKNNQLVMEFFKELLATGFTEHGNEIKRALRIFKRYMRWSKERDIGHKLMGSELHFEVPLQTKLGRNFYLHGYLDLLTKFNGRIYCWDHKSFGSSNGFWTDREVASDFQTNCYVLGISETGVDVNRVVINQMNTYDYVDFSAVENEQLFRRNSASVTPIKVKNFKTELFKMVDNLLDSYAEPKRSLHRSCASRCSFYDPCIMSLQGFDEKPILLTYKKKEALDVEAAETDA